MISQEKIREYSLKFLSGRNETLFRSSLFGINSYTKKDSRTNRDRSNGVPTRSDHKFFKTGLSLCMYYCFSSSRRFMRLLSKNSP